MCSALNGEKISIVIQNKKYSAITDKKGFATFNKMPCGQSAIISLPFTKIQREISCSKSVYLGSFTDSGSKVAESDANECIY